MDEIAVTGGSGFIGSAVVSALEARGDKARVIDRRQGHDILLTDLRDVFDGCQSVIHLAGVLGTSELFENIEEAVAVNVTGTVRVLEACRDTGAGYVGITMHDRFPSIYTATKLAAQRFGSAFHNAYGLPVCHVRAYNAYGAGQAHGPGHPRKIVPAFACEAWSDQPISIWGDGNQTVDLIHTEELARILVEATAVENDAVIDAGSGKAISVNEVARRVLKITGSKAGVKHLPMRKGEIPSNICARGLGWSFLSRPPKETWDLFEKTVVSYQTHEMVAGWAA